MKIFEILITNTDESAHKKACDYLDYLGVGYNVNIRPATAEEKKRG